MKVFTSIVFSLAILPIFAQAPVNDDCAGLIDLGEIPYCSDPAQYTNVDATASNISLNDNIPVCFNNGVERDVWFMFTMPADGSIVDIEISIWGDVDGNGTLQMPQVAIYRGDCLFEGLAELDCAAAPLNVNELHLAQFGLTPGLPYFLRINDYSATGSPNAGTFRLCIEKYIPEVNMGEVASTESCTGTLWDSGGPTADYTNNEDLTFTICPQDFHQCIVINVESYTTEPNFDFLSFYIGDDISGTQLTQLTGFGNNFEVQVPGDCATIRFTSDFLVTEEGFQITWLCSPDVCTTPPPTTCADPAVVPGLPFEEDGLSNCFSGNTLDDGPCDDAFLFGNDYIFTYTSPGDECIHIETAGTSVGAGLAIYDQCPTLAGTNCITSAGGGFNSVNPIVNAAFLENPGTYYILFGSSGNCTPFDISIDTITCPIVLPPAATCDAALNIGGCPTDIPQIIALTPGAGDPGFIVDGVNQGCFVAPQQNFSFFWFEAGADGQFGFTVQAADPNEASDIDFNVWGPIADPADICDYVSNNQPIRSSWAAGADPTGLASTNVGGMPVLDDFDCGSPATPGAGGDDFVSLIDVLEGEIYVIMLDDYGNAIIQGGISIDFGETTPGVLSSDQNISVSGDTSICAGQSVQLNASGGAAYVWATDPSLSCTNCPDPIATPDQTTTYQVQVASTCNTVTEFVEVKVYDIDLGPDVTVCNNAVFTLNPNNPFPEAEFAWIGQGLSCADCPSPEVSGLSTGIYTYFAILTTPLCTQYDTLKIIVVNGQAPQYVIADDQVICAGTTVDLGGPAQLGTFYGWSSVPPGFVSTAANPSVTPSATTTYYLTAANATCPLLTQDSVTITVYQPPVLAVQGDTAICQGQSVVLGTTAAEAGVTYAWTPPDGLDDPAAANPLATPTQTSVYTLTASNPGCITTAELTIAVTTIDLQLNTPDTVRICQGTPVPVQATVDPPGTTVVWTPGNNLQIGPGGLSAVATPFETTLYTATVSVPGCVRTASLFVAVDSLPDELAILPLDTTICQGQQVLLTSTIYEPAEYPEIEFLWTPGDGQLTPDSLYNMVVQPMVTTVYQRLTTSGLCTETSTATVTVIPPAQMTITPANPAFCPGDSVQLNLTYTPGVTEIMWEPPTALSCIDCDNPVANPTTTTTYTAMGMFNGCPASASVTVEVQPLPAYQFPADLQLCAGESITLNLTDDGISAYSWTSTTGFISGNAQPTLTPTQTGTYFLTANNGCMVQDQLTVTVFSSTLEAFGDTTICQNFPTTLSAAGGLPGSYVWSDGQSGQAIQVTPTETTLYTVTYTYGDNCQLTDQVTVTVQGEGISFDFPNDQEICPGESVILNAGNNLPGAVFAWTAVPPDPDLDNNTAYPEVSPDQTTTYTVTAAVSGQCTNTAQVTIQVDLATLTVSNDTTICEGNPLTLTANGSFVPAGSYTWTPGNVNGPQWVNPPTGADTTYYVQYQYGDGCSLFDSVQINAVMNFGLDIVADPAQDTLDLGEPLELNASVTTTGGLTGYQFVWTENGEPVGTTQLIDITPSTNEQSVLYQVVVTSPIGCVNTATLNIFLRFPEVRIPTAFTPDGDGTNETFGLVVVEGIANVERMEVYNRWGQKVFSSTDAAARWDGMVDGKPAPTDVYVYNILWRRGDGALQPPAVGEVTLLR